MVLEICSNEYARYDMYSFMNSWLSLVSRSSSLSDQVELSSYIHFLEVQAKNISKLRAGALSNEGSGFVRQCFCCS